MRDTITLLLVLTVVTVAVFALIELINDSYENKYHAAQHQHIDTMRVIECPPLKFVGRSGKRTCWESWE